MRRCRIPLTQNSCSLETPGVLGSPAFAVSFAKNLKHCRVPYLGPGRSLPAGGSSGRWDGQDLNLGPQRIPRLL